MLGKTLRSITKIQPKEEEKGYVEGKVRSSSQEVQFCGIRGRKTKARHFIECNLSG